MSEKTFDCTRDKQIAAGTHFWCTTHQTARPLAERSPDPRYCRECYDFLKNEAALLTSFRRPAWIPKDSPAAPAVTPPPAVQPRARPVTSPVTIKNDVPAGVTAPNGNVDKRIKALAGEGLSTRRDIAAALQNEGMTISYRTVARHLQGALL